MSMKEEFTAIDMATAAADGFRAGQRAAQSAPAVERETIRAVFLRNGFTVKEGQTDLKPYVYAAAEELLSISRAQLPGQGVETVDLTAEVNRLKEALEVARTDELNAAVWAETDKLRHDLWDAQAELENLRAINTSPVGEIEVVGVRISTDGFGSYIADSAMGVGAAMPGEVREPLMTVAQHNRIVAALSAQQSAPDRVSVPVELLQDLHDLASDAVDHHRQAFAGYKLERQANMEATVDKARALLDSHAEGGKV